MVNSHLARSSVSCLFVPLPRSQWSLVLPYRFDRRPYSSYSSATGYCAPQPGTTIAQASADVARLIPLSLTPFPHFGGSVKMFEEARITPNVRSLKDDRVGDVRTVLWVLIVDYHQVLLIACANVANLLSSGAESRQQELAIRAALAPGRPIARELLLESVLLGILGGDLGLALRSARFASCLARAWEVCRRLADIALGPAGGVFAFRGIGDCRLLFGAIPVFKYAGARVWHHASRRWTDHERKQDLIGTQHPRSGARCRWRSYCSIAPLDDSKRFYVLSRVHPGFHRPIKCIRSTLDPGLAYQGESLSAHAPGDHVQGSRGSRVSSVVPRVTVTMTGDAGVIRVRAGPHLYRRAMPPLRLFNSSLLGTWARWGRRWSPSASLRGTTHIS